MILHDFIYDWDGKSHDGEKPVAWWPGSYRVRIVKLDSGKDNVQFIKPLAVIVKNNHSKSGTSLRNYIHNFAQIIAKRYDFQIEKAMWIEIEEDVKVALISADRNLQDGPLYVAKWRPVRPNELETLKLFIEDLI